MPYQSGRRGEVWAGVFDLLGRQDQLLYLFFFQAEDGIRDPLVTGVQTCALPISSPPLPAPRGGTASEATPHCSRWSASNLRPRSTSSILEAERQCSLVGKLTIQGSNSPRHR